MVAKESLPDLKIHLKYQNFMLCLPFIISYFILPKVSGLQYCWKGTEDNLSGWKNQSCLTGETSLGNSLSMKLLPGHEDAGGTGDHNATQSYNRFYCMAFKSFETMTKGASLSVKTYTVDYGCDLDNICAGKDMNQGIKYQRNGSDGMLYCCNDINNCNTHTMVKSTVNSHRCYNAVSDGNKQTIDIETCPSDDTYCLRVIKHELIMDERYKVVSQSYSCDATNMCADYGLTDTLDKACKEFKDSKNIDTEVCCCKDETCFTPDWTEAGMAHPALNPGAQTNAIQRTILIGIGIAIGLLLATVALFVYMRYRKISRTKHNLNDKMVYSAVTESEEIREDDNVNILSRA